MQVNETSCDRSDEIPGFYQESERGSLKTAGKCFFLIMLVSMEMPLSIVSGICTLYPMYE